jgi:hypothetical protein
LLSSGLLILIKKSIGFIATTVLKFVRLSGNTATAKLKFLLGEKFVCVNLWYPEWKISCRKSSQTDSEFIIFAAMFCKKKNKCFKKAEKICKDACE